MVWYKSFIFDDKSGEHWDIIRKKIKEQEEKEQHVPTQEEKDQVERDKRQDINSILLKIKRNMTGYYDQYTMAFKRKLESLDLSNIKEIEREINLFFTRHADGATPDRRAKENKLKDIIQRKY
ncbi:MAG: hypothetical protein AABY32_04430 [Nanoarchaeota archaeon]